MLVVARIQRAGNGLEAGEYQWRLFARVDDHHWTKVSQVAQPA